MSAQYIGFSYAGPSRSGKTELWNVRAASDNAYLGQIRWFGSWRQYVFYPEELTIFSAGCLRSIADYCDFLSKRHRDNLKTRTGR